MNIARTRACGAMKLTRTTTQTKNCAEKQTSFTGKHTKNSTAEDNNILTTEDASARTKQPQTWITSNKTTKSNADESEITHEQR